MKILGLSGILSILLAIIFNGCDYPQNAPLNPNGDSELAILMRAMDEDAQKMKKQVLYGGKPSTSIDHSKMLSAEATEPEKVETEEYKGFSDSYLNVVSSFREANQEKASQLYTQMIDLCKSCHQSLCPGPIVKIDKLYLDHPLTE